MKRLLIIIWFILIMNGFFPVIIFCRSEVATPAHSSRELQRCIRSVLKDPRFQYRHSFVWLSRIIAKLKSFFDRLPKKQEYAFDTEWLKPVLKPLSLVLVALLPLLITFYLSRFFNGNARLKKQRSNTITGHSPDARFLLKNAEVLAEDGNYHEAIRLLYLASLKELEERGFLPQTETISDDTNLKMLKRILGAENPAFQHLSDLVRIYQEKWYGMKLCLSDEYYRARQHQKIFWQSIEQIHV